MNKKEVNIVTNGALSNLICTGNHILSDEDLVQILHTAVRTVK